MSGAPNGRTGLSYVLGRTTSGRPAGGVGVAGLADGGRVSAGALAGPSASGVVLGARLAVTMPPERSVVSSSSLDRVSVSGASSLGGGGFRGSCLVEGVVGGGLVGVDLAASARALVVVGVAGSLLRAGGGVASRVVGGAFSAVVVWLGAVGVVLAGAGLAV
jgi:hypothetical protein